VSDMVVKPMTFGSGMVARPKYLHNFYFGFGKVWILTSILFTLSLSLFYFIKISQSSYSSSILVCYSTKA
jgi:hypothetical protein